jgi:hypothetical protein
LKNGKHLFEFKAYDGKDYSDIVKTEQYVDNRAPSSKKGLIPMLDAGTALTLLISIGALALIRRNLVRSGHS